MQRAPPGGFKPRGLLAGAGATMAIHNPPIPVPGQITHVEINSQDPAKSRKFYEAVFGWKFQESSIPGMDYLTWSAPAPPHGGLWKPPAAGTPKVVSYIAVESIEKTTAKITKAGGKVLVPKTEIPKMGWYSVFQDPDGATWGVFQGP